MQCPFFVPFEDYRGVVLGAVAPRRCLRSFEVLALDDPLAPELDEPVSLLAVLPLALVSDELELPDCADPD